MLSAYFVTNLSSSSDIFFNSTLLKLGFIFKLTDDNIQYGGVDYYSDDKLKTWLNNNILSLLIIKNTQPGNIEFATWLCYNSTHSFCK